jgi:hypothetical protein
MKLLLKIFSYLLVATPVILFFYFFAINIVDVPINDDFALLDFINKYLESNNFSEKIKLLFAQHNEHRIFYDRMFTLLSYKLIGTVNFTFLATIGNLSLIVICLIFYKIFNNLKRNVIYFVPVTVLLFSLSSWENITFPMATLSNFSVLLFIISSIFFLTKNEITKKTELALAFLLFVLAVFTQGAGVFLIPISSFIFLIKKEYKTGFIYLLFQILILLIYFYDYENYGNNKSILDLLLTEKLALIKFMFAFLGSSLSYFLVFTNNSEQSIIFTTIAGFLFSFFFLFITYKKYYKQNLFIYCLMALIVLSAIAVSFSRIGNGIETAVASRYRINSLLFLIAIYFWVIDTIRLKNDRILLYPILVASISFFFFISLKHTEYLDIRKRQTVYGVLSYDSGDISNLNGDKQFLNFYRETFNKSKELKTYFLPSNEVYEKYFPFSKKAIIGNSTSSSQRFLNVSVDNVKELKDSFLIEGWAFPEGLDTRNQTIFIGLNEEKTNETVYFSTNIVLRHDLSPYFKISGLLHGGFSARIKKEFIKNATFNILVLSLNNNEILFKQTDKLLKKE